MKILVIGDIHGNAEALAAVLEKEKDADTTVFLGDSVLPGPQPNQVISLLKGLSGTFIMGNHDIEVLEPERFANWPANWLAFNRGVLDEFEPAGYEFLKTLKPEGEYEVGGIRMYLKHGVLPDRPPQALPDTSDDRLSTLADGSDCPIVLFGHSHIQFKRTINGQEFINPGSVGQPRCGKMLACYGLFEDGVFRHCNVSYDATPWLKAMDEMSTLDEFPEFRDWIKNGLITGYGIGENEPWTRFAKEGYL
jgi:putative phosphoesterase